MAANINQQSLEKAKRGIFSIDKMDMYGGNYLRSGGKHSLSDYYTAAYYTALFDRTLSENIIFADHSLATDSVFSETHLVCCRNVLIYFNKTLQSRALGLFHESLFHRGFLTLGSKESLDFSAYANHFLPLSKPERLFRKL